LAHTFPSTSPYRAIAFACFSAGAPIGSGLGTLAIFFNSPAWVLRHEVERREQETKRSSSSSLSLLLHSRLSGSVFGGIFTQYATWRALFWFTAAVTVIPLVLGFFVVPPDRLEPGRDTRQFARFASPLKLGR